MVSLTFRLTASLLVVALALGGCRTSMPEGGVAPRERTTASPLRVMTFNLRLDVASDGPNAWPHRRDWVAALIRFHAPDALGVQEALAHMLTDLDAAWARSPAVSRSS